MPTYRIKAIWRGTSKVLLIEAKTPETAIIKATKMKENLGAMEFIHLGASK